METEKPLPIPQPNKIDFKTSIPQPNKIDVQTNITAKIYYFSQVVPARNVNNKLLFENETHELNLKCTIFNSGSTSQYRGYVTVEIVVEFQKGIFICDSLILNSFISVLDNAGNKRFIRTFSEYEAKILRKLLNTSVLMKTFYLYLSRQTLLNDPDELLPNDILTIDIDISFVLEWSITDESERLIGCHTEREKLITSSCKSSSSDKVELFLNSPVIKTLCEVSTFFRDLFAYTARDNAEFMEMPTEDFSFLIYIYKIITEAEYELTFSDIFELLRVSDKYDVLNMPEICRQLIKQCLGSKMLSWKTWKQHSTLELLMYLANKCRDATVLELVEAFVKKQDPNFEFQDFKTNDTEILKLFLINIYIHTIKASFKCTYEPTVGFKITPIFVSGENRSNSYYN